MLFFLALATWLSLVSFADATPAKQDVNQISSKEEGRCIDSSNKKSSNALASKQQSNAKIINYTISTKDDLRAFTVEVKFRGNSSGKTDVYIPVLGGIDVEHSIFSAVSGKETLKIVPGKDRECMRSFPYYCQIVSILHKPNVDITLSYITGHSPYSFASKNSIIFRGSGVFAYPKLDENQRNEILIDSKAFGKKGAKMISGSNIHNMPEKMPTNLENLFSSFYIFTDLDINISQYDKEAGALVVTVGFPLEGDDNAILSHKYITYLARKILNFNAKFVE